MQSKPFLVQLEGISSHSIRHSVIPVIKNIGFLCVNAEFIIFCKYLAIFQLKNNTVRCIIYSASAGTWFSDKFGSVGMVVEADDPKSLF